MHSDEGTIHAWLDGELPADEAVALEAHVATCASCAALVAEARGVMAASSRILSALDDVPGGVLPRPGARPPVLTIERGGNVAPAPRPRRVWWRSPQFAAAAALVVMVLGTWSVVRRSGDVTAPAAVNTSEAAAPAVAAAPAATPQDTPVEFRAPVPSGAASRVELRAKQPAADIAVAREAVAAAGASSANAAPPATPAPVAAARDLATVAAESLRASGARSAELDESARKTTRAEKAVEQERARVEGEVRAQAALPPPAPATVSRRTDASSDRAGRSASGPMPMRCFTLARRPDAERSGVPATVQLLEMAGPTVGGRTLKMVMSSAGVGWFWSTAPDGSLILLRVVNDAVVYEARITGVTASDVVATERACTGTP